MTITEYIDSQYALSDENRLIMINRLKANIAEIQKYITFLESK